MQQIVRSISLALNALPRPHRIMLGALTVATLAVAVWRPHVYHLADNESSVTQPIEPDEKQLSRLLPEASEPIDQSLPSPEEDIPKDELDDSVPVGKGTHQYTISAGDTLSNILNQYGIELSDIHQLFTKDPALGNLRIGQQLSWGLNEEGQLIHLSWKISRRETRTYKRSGNGFIFSKEMQKGEWQDHVLRGQLNGSFAVSAKRAGLNNSEISEVVKALQWQMDFRKLRRGDHFSVLLSREMLAGRNEQSQLLGVRLLSNGKDYSAIRAEDGKFYDYYGSGLAHGFLRFPTSRPYRVSSNFNPRRLNPVTGRIAPHKGVDFALPIGTPVLAVGDGEIVVAKRSGGAGNYIAIRHGRQYMTRYMHLKKMLVKPGQKVKRGERIALSGNTGRSTGPHLHYEVWVNNQAVNPLTVKLPRADGLSGIERKAFLAKVKEITPQLSFEQPDKTNGEIDP